MSSSDSKTITFSSNRFGEFTVAEESLIFMPGGVVGFPKNEKFVLLEHKPPFSWLHATDNPDLAFVVVDGVEFGEGYKFPIPYGDPRCDLLETDEYAVLVIVTVRTGPAMTTANLKAPLIVNLRTRKGVQLIIDDSQYSTKYPLWQENPQQKQDTKDKKDK